MDGISNGNAPLKFFDQQGGQSIYAAEVDGESLVDTLPDLDKIVFNFGSNAEKKHDGTVSQ